MKRKVIFLGVSLGLLSFLVKNETFWQEISAKQRKLQMYFELNLS